MDLYPSEIEESIRDTSAKFLRDNVPIAGARGRPETLWREMAELGWLGIALPEDKGGIGMGFATEALVFAELGRSLAPIGVLASAVAAHVASAAGQDDLAGKIISGTARVAIAVPDGDKLRLLETRHADLFLLAGSERAALHARDGAPWETLPCLDPSTQQALIRPAAVAPHSNAPGGRAALHQMIAAAAFALGAAEAARDMAAAYASTREQFGRPIGSFQGVKHPCADMAVRASAARAQLLYAALVLDDDSPEAAFEIAAAKKLADIAAVENARANVQVHGGIGMTDEADVHLILKRAHLLSFVSPVSATMLLA